MTREEREMHDTIAVAARAEIWWDETAPQDPGHAYRLYDAEGTAVGTGPLALDSSQDDQGLCAQAVEQIRPGYHLGWDAAPEGPNATWSWEPTSDGWAVEWLR
jgi:hypothetical protein